VAAVLFVGLAIGSLHPDLKLPEIVYLLGLVLFVYTIGLRSGPGFLASFRRKGLRDNLLVVTILILAAILTFILARLLGLTPALTAGLYAGSLTNTPALASVLDNLKSHLAGAGLEQVLAEPVIGCSIAYPMGVVGMILAIYLVRHLWQVDYAAEARTLCELGVTNVRLQNRTIRVTQPEATGESIHDLLKKHAWKVVFGRMKHADQLSLANGLTHLAVGDLVSVIGTPEDLERVTTCMGEVSEE
jgi:putative transport protein